VAKKAREIGGAIDIPQETIWGSLLLVNFARLRALVEAGNETQLADFLGSVFRTETVNGFHYGTQLDELPHQWAYLPINIELSVVTLAECLGILRTEQHEQGEVAYWRREFTEQSLMDALEAYFGFRIEAPSAGNPRGILFGGRFLTRETCSHLYSAHRMSRAIGQYGPAGELRIVEIGGGYGGTAYWLRRILGNRVARYTIVDLPEVALLQTYFLGHVDPATVSMYGEAPLPGSTATELVPHFHISEINFRPNIVINQDSMPEMPLSEVERYMDWIVGSADGLFLSYNQEAYSVWEGVPQIHVPTVAAQHPGLVRLARETSWSRRGYVEEIYRLGAM